jgi:quercetin dioxygenase-like cupin family protein
MEVIQSPQIEIIQEAASLKIIRVKGESGMHMPDHHSTREAVVIGQKGSATLFMEGKEYKINEGSSTIIPAGVNHSLTTHQGFLALVIMDIKSTIIFENN